MDKKTQFIFEIEPDEPANSQPILDLVSNEADQEKSLKVRLDKWLWAARFFKTRALARSAIEAGRIFYEGQKTIPSKEISVGANIFINQGKSKKMILVRQLSTRRRSTDEANALFEEVAVQMYTAAEPVTMDFAPSNDSEKKPRKIARFLRRALAIGEAESPVE